MSSAEWAYFVGRQHAVLASGAYTRLTGCYSHRSRNHPLIRIFVVPSFVEGLVALEHFVIQCQVLEMSMSRFIGVALPIDLVNFIGMA